MQGLNTGDVVVVGGGASGEITITSPVATANIAFTEWLGREHDVPESVFPAEADVPAQLKPFAKIASLTFQLAEGVGAVADVDKGRLKDEDWVFINIVPDKASGNNIRCVCVLCCVCFN